MRKIALIGKEVLGRNGFFSKPNGLYLNEENIFLEQIDRIKACLNIDNVYMTSLVSKNDLKKNNFKYLPTIMNFSHEYSKIFNPSFVFNRGRRSPNIDFIVWHKEDNINVMTYTKTAPSIYFESEDGTYCLGTISEKAIKCYGKYIFDEIFKRMNVNPKNKIKCVIASYFETPKLTIKDNINIFQYICYILKDMPNVTDVESKYKVNNEKECFYEKESGNHVIVSFE